MHQIQDQGEVRQAALNPLLQSLGTIGERHAMLDVRSVALANGDDQSVKGLVFALQGDAQLFGDGRWARLFGSHKGGLDGLPGQRIGDGFDVSSVGRDGVDRRHDGLPLLRAPLVALGVKGHSHALAVRLDDQDGAFLLLRRGRFLVIECLDVSGILHGHALQGVLGNPHAQNPFQQTRRLVVLAVLLDEPRATSFATMLSGAVISAVNLAEVVSKLAEQGGRLPVVRQVISTLGLDVRAFEADDAQRSGMLRPLTNRQGLSLGDRSCIALAQRLGAAVLTCDRSWQELDLGIDVRVLG